MNRYEVSVVVPVYNCEKFLKKSINSIICQTIFDNLEVLLIDDGSTDDSLSILMDYSAKYPNILTYHQENKGVSAARNLGIDKSTGKYITFFDADDFANPRLYETLLELIDRYSVDIAIVDYSMVFQNGTSVKHRNEEVVVWENKEDLFIDYFKTNRICSNPVDKIFKNDIARSARFPEGYSIGEDMFFVYEALKLANRVVLDSTESLYDYVLRDGSAMKSDFSIKMLDPIKLMKIILDDFQNGTEIYKYAESKYYNEVCKTMSLLSRTSNSQFDSLRKELRKELKDCSLIKSYKYMSKKHCIAILLMKLSPSLYNCIYDLLKIG